MSKKESAPLADDVSEAALNQLRSFIERIERLLEEAKAIADDVKDIYAEAKGSGFDTKVMKKIIALRKKDAAERQEEDATLDTYLRALGMYQLKFNFDDPEEKRAA